jgi:microcystin-dependent protein
MGWLFLDGATYSQSTYPTLAAVFGVTTGTFTLPDMRGAFVVGRDTVGVLVEKDIELQNFYPNTTYSNTHAHTTSLAHSHADTIAVSSHASHTHSVDPAAVQSGGAVNSSPASGNTYVNSASGASYQYHGHSVDIPATTSGGPSATLSHTVTGAVTAQAATSTASSGSTQTLNFVRTELNFIIKT